MRSLRVDLVDAFRFADGGAIAIATVGRFQRSGAVGGTVPGASDIRLTLPLAGPPPWAGLHQLATEGGAVQGARGGRLVGRPGRHAGVFRARRGPPSVRPSPGDQSHTSVIVDEQVMLKLYRRLSPGRNPEADALDALDGIGGAPVPDWAGAVEFFASGRSEPTTIAIAQRFVADAGDAFEALADAIAAWLAGSGRPASTTVITAAGVATAVLHRALAGLSAHAEHRDRSTTVRVPAPASRRRPRTAAPLVGHAELDDAMAAVAQVDPELARRLSTCRPAILRAMHPIDGRAGQGPVQRIHGDLHLGQILVTPGGVLIVDFEGDPTRDPEVRAEPDSVLRDVASFLRSIDHVARSGRRRAVGLGASAADPEIDRAVDQWISGARRDFLAGYRSVAGTADWARPGSLLRAFEVEKEVRELVYAARFLPDWLYAPRAGLNALLGCGL